MVSFDKKLILILLLVIIWPVDKANGFISTANVRIDNFNYTQTLLQAYPETGAVSGKGVIFSNKFSFEIPRFKMEYLAPKILKMKINFDRESISLITQDQIKTTIEVAGIGTLKEVKSLNLKGFIADIDDENLSLSGDFFAAKIKFFGYKLNHFDFNCWFEDSAYFAENCTKNFNSKIDSGHIKIGQSRIDLLDVLAAVKNENVFVNIREVSFMFAGYKAYAFDFELNCFSNFFSNMGFTLGPQINACLQESEFHLGGLQLNSENGKLEINIPAFDKIDFKGNSIKISNPSYEILYEKYLLEGDDIAVECQKEDFDSMTLSFKEIGKWCMKNSLITLDESRVTVDEASILTQKNIINFQDNYFEMKAKLFMLQTKDSVFSINDLKYKCNRIITGDDYYDFTSLTKDCFNSSKLEMGTSKIMSTDYLLDANIKEVKLNKNTFHANLPEVIYHLNEGDVTFNQALLNCDLHATMNDLTDLNMDAIIKNCISDSHIEIDELKREEEKGFKLFKYLGMEDVDYRCSEGIFKLKLSPKIKYFNWITPGLLNAKVKGSIKYLKERKIIDINISSIKMMKIIPSSSLILYLLRTFVKMDSVVHDGKHIQIYLNKDMIEAD